MGKRGIYTDTDGQLHQLIPIYGGSGQRADETDEEYYERFVAKMLPAGAICYEMDEDDAPSDRTFRNAWECPTGVIQVNMDKARVIHMDAIRVVRNAELAAKDITFMRAVEAGDASAQSTIGTEKQVLRDIPATFDLTTDVGTPELLKARWPTELPARE